jgi:hypothetical protein
MKFYCAQGKRATRLRHAPNGCQESFCQAWRIVSSLFQRFMWLSPRQTSVQDALPPRRRGIGGSDTTRNLGQVEVIRRFQVLP